MSGDPRLHALEQERKAAQAECVRLQQGWGTSQQRAQDYLDAKEHLIGVLETIERIDPYHYDGKISDAIEVSSRKSCGWGSAGRRSGSWAATRWP